MPNRLFALCLRQGSLPPFRGETLGGWKCHGAGLCFFPMHRRSAVLRAVPVAKGPTQSVVSTTDHQSDTVRRFTSGGRATLWQ